jgi:hypothetical protein
MAIYHSNPQFGLISCSVSQFWDRHLFVVPVFFRKVSQIIIFGNCSLSGFKSRSVDGTLGAVSQK